MSELMSTDMYRDYQELGGCAAELMVLWGFPENPAGKESGSLHVFSLETRSHARASDSWRHRIRAAWNVLRGVPMIGWDFMGKDEVDRFMAALERGKRAVWGGEPDVCDKKLGDSL